MRSSFTPFLFALFLYVCVCPLPAFAHHYSFYKAIFAAIEKDDVESIRSLFSDSAWKGETGISGGELQIRLEDGAVTKPMEELSSVSPRDKTIIRFRIDYLTGKSDIIRVLGKDVDQDLWKYRWEIISVVDSEKEAQAFFKHTPPWY